MLCPSLLLLRQCVWMVQKCAKEKQIFILLCEQSLLCKGSHLVAQVVGSVNLEVWRWQQWVCIFKYYRQCVWGGLAVCMTFACVCLCIRVFAYLCMRVYRQCVWGGIGSVREHAVTFAFVCICAFVYLRICVCECTGRAYEGVLAVYESGQWPSPANASWSPAQGELTTSEHTIQIQIHLPYKYKYIYHINTILCKIQI